MRGMLRYRPSPATAIALAALAVALGGVAYATIPDSNGTIHGCYQKNGGSLRVVESSSDCRSSEQALDWNQQGPPGEASGARVLKPFSLAPGERRLLFQAGTVTFTASCRFTTEVFTSGEYVSSVEVTTSQDHAAVEVDSGHNANRDLLVGQTWNLPGARAPVADASIFDWSFSADSPDGTNVTGIVSTGVNQRGNTGKCQFGGQIAVSKES
jgi:hypothetical protein